MKHSSSFLLVALTVSLATGAFASTDPIVGRQVPAFSTQALDLSGEAPKPEPFDSTAAKGVTVYMIVGVTCPASNAYGERVSQLQKLYAPKKVDFLYVYSNREDTLERKIAFHRQADLGGKLIDDKGGEIAKKLGARRTSEIFVTDPAGKIVYHGAVDDSRDPGGVKQHYLQMALDETLAGTPVTVATSPVAA